ncbi:MAG: S8 family serine peptidase [Polyangiaceae bacterium]
MVSDRTCARAVGRAVFSASLLALVAMFGCASSADSPGEDAESEAFALTPNDPSFGLQWGLRNTGQTVSSADANPASQTGARGVDINAIAAWDITQGSSSVIVAVIDGNGVNVDHEDLKDRIFVNTGEIPNDGIDNDGNGYVDDYKGYNFAGSGAGSHGTGIAGVIAATANNGKGMSGVAPKVRILPIGAQIGDSAQMVAAIRYAGLMGAKIANISQGTATYDAATYAAIQSSGILFTMSAGNRGTGAYNYPSSYDLPNILAVANIENLGRLALSSNYGEPHVDIAAPGWNTYTPLATGNSAYGYQSGTSMAAPHVAGVAALVWSRKSHVDAGASRFAFAVDCQQRTRPDRHGEVGRPGRRLRLARRRECNQRHHDACFGSHHARLGRAVGCHALRRRGGRRHHRERAGDVVRAHGADQRLRARVPSAGRDRLHRRALEQAHHSERDAAAGSRVGFGQQRPQLQQQYEQGVLRAGQERGLDAHSFLARRRRADRQRRAQ